MNCRKGEMAIVVMIDGAGGRTDENLGKIVTCLEFIGGPIMSEGMALFRKDLWRVDRPMVWFDILTGEYTEAPYAPDIALRPLRGDLKEDDVVESKELETV